MIPISMSQDERLAILETHMTEIKSDVKDIRLALLGNGNTDGMKVRVDRLEQSEQKRSRVMWLFGTAILVGIIERFFNQ